MLGGTDNLGSSLEVQLDGVDAKRIYYTFVFMETFNTAEVWDLVRQF